MIVFFAILIGFSAVVATPVVAIESTLKRYLKALAIVFVGITIPLAVFFLSFFLVPEWKGASEFGWLGCFHVGKFALLPLVVWACGAFWAIMCFGPEQRSRTWVVLGIFNGAVVSGACFVIGMLIHSHEGELLPWMFLPFYIAAWYWFLCVDLIREAKLDHRLYGGYLLGSSPFWVVTFFWMRNAYAALPDEPPFCFVVTAATGGSAGLVGPFTEIERAGATRLANRQLLRFWQFEALWQSRSPATHRCFRRVYNRIGPVVAACIRTRFLANVVYLGLKPLEWAAVLILRVAR